MIVTGNHKQHDTSPGTKGKGVGINPASICHYGNIIILVFLSLYFFIIPFGIIVYYLADPNLKGEGIPRIAFWLHRCLSPKYERWARERVSQGQAQQLALEDIAGTEWPLFGSVFYLLATESLQEAWQAHKNPSSPAPKEYAAGAIAAATELVADPGHAGWVKQHWGKDYLHRENVFYRMLLISALTSYQKLLGDKKYTPLLRDQVETFSQELDKSPYGLLDDYPSQCFPTDVVAAIAAIKRADAVLGTDHHDFINRSVRAFEGRFVDATGLPPYAADSTTGIIGEARGCSSQWITVWAPQLWPEYAQKLYENFDKHFWQTSRLAAGFREFPPNEADSEWYFDVDSGPVIAGFGAAASAFGLGAAKANGRCDQAYPLTTEVIVLSWPLANGTLAGARLLSNTVNAPYLGEAALLFSLTRTANKGTKITLGEQMPILVYLILAGYLGVGILLLTAVISAHQRRKRLIFEKIKPWEKIQLIFWLALITAGVVFWVRHYSVIGLTLILSAQFLPRKPAKEYKK